MKNTSGSISFTKLCLHAKCCRYWQPAIHRSQKVSLRYPRHSVCVFVLMSHSQTLQQPTFICASTSTVFHSAVNWKKWKKSHKVIKQNHRNPNEKSEYSWKMTHDTIQTLCSIPVKPCSQWGPPGINYYTTCCKTHRQKKEFTQWVYSFHFFFLLFLHHFSVTSRFFCLQQLWCWARLPSTANNVVIHIVRVRVSVRS